MKITRLVSVGAFYKNDTPNGIGINMKDIDSNMEKIIIESMNDYEGAWKSFDEKKREQLVESYFNQLDCFAKFRTQDRTIEQNFICIMNIWFLEKYSFLKSDQFNGYIFLYGQD